MTDFLETGEVEDEAKDENTAVFSDRFRGLSIRLGRL